MQLGKDGLNLIKSFEGLYLESYLCPANVWTIGYGSILWPDKKPVQPGQKITMDQAEKLLAHEVTEKTREIAAILPPSINQNQFDSLLSFAYNLGTGALKNSTLLKKVKANPNDPTIRDEFMKWNKARVKGKLTELKGLTRRRKAEADLYFKTI
jgi:lysozyme